MITPSPGDDYSLSGLSGAPRLRIGAGAGLGLKGDDDPDPRCETVRQDKVEPEPHVAREVEGDAAPRDFELCIVELRNVEPRDVELGVRSVDKVIRIEIDRYDKVTCLLTAKAHHLPRKSSRPRPEPASENRLGSVHRCSAGQA